MKWPPWHVRLELKINGDCIMSFFSPQIYLLASGWSWPNSMDIPLARSFISGKVLSPNSKIQFGNRDCSDSPRCLWVDQIPYSIQPGNRLTSDSNLRLNWDDWHVATHFHLSTSNFINPSILGKVMGGMMLWLSTSFIQGPFFWIKHYKNCENLWNFS